MRTPKEIIDLVSRALLASLSMTVAKRAVTRSSDSRIKKRSVLSVT